MKRALLAAAALAAIVGAPAFAWAAAPSAPIAAVHDQPGARLNVSAPGGDSGRQVADYAAREAAAPELGAFQGGDGGIYIGGSAVGIVLVVVLIVLIL